MQKEYDEAMQKDRKRQEADNAYAKWMHIQHQSAQIKREENRAKKELKRTIEAK